MTESPVAITAGDAGLLGVLTDPETETGVARHGVVLLNAGFTHHVGPQRLHVRLARRLAAVGFLALRFDVSGIGDSPRRRDGMPFAERFVIETRAAMDHLQRTRGLDRFVLFGMCWGADNAMRIAAADERVVGVVAVDFYAVTSARYLARFYLPRLLNARSWRQWLGGRSAVGQRLRELVRPRRGASDAEDALHARSPGEVLAEIDRLSARGARLCFAYARAGGSFDQYALHFRRRLAELEAAGTARVRVFADCDHVFTPARSQEALCRYVEDWARGLQGPA